jgi:hypothetical protein
LRRRGWQGDEKTIGSLAGLPQINSQNRPCSEAGLLLISYILSEGESKLGGICHFSAAEKWLKNLEGIRPDFPTGLSFSTAHRERFGNLSHLRKTLNPGVPVLP